MTRNGLFVLGGIAGASVLSFGVYAMKYEVERLDRHAAALQRDITRQEQTLHVLEAEWSYLNQPERLQELSDRHLGLAPVPVRRIGALDELPFRVAAQPAKGRDPLLRLLPPASPAQAAPVVK